MPASSRAHQVLRRGDAEVGDEGHAVFVEQDVFGLDVAVHDAEVVGGAETAQNLAHDRERRVLVERRAPREVLEEIVGVDVLHRNERIALGESEVETLHDVAMADAARQLQFVLEALERVGIVVNRQREHLERDHFVDRLVDGGTDVAHRAGAEESLDAVAAREDRCRARASPRTASVSGARRFSVSDLISVASLVASAATNVGYVFSRIAGVG